MDFSSPAIWLKIAPDIPLQTILHSSSQQAEEINRVTYYFFLAAGGMLLIVTALTAYILFTFRAGKSKQSLCSISTRWEIAMIGIPALLVAIFLYLSISTMNSIAPTHEGHAPLVTITGHQWWWEAQYTNGNTYAANEIHLPAGEKILLQLNAADVIHDWWVPAFGNKMDMIPAQNNYLWVTIKEPGVYEGVCSEFCGPQHAHMRIKVIAQTPEDFNDWLMRQQTPAPASAAVAQGARLFITKTCSNCHRINGTEAAGTAGPDLTHIASRQTLLAGMLENNFINLENWIRHPQDIKPGAHMPDFLLDTIESNAIAAYLYSLK